MSDDAINDLKPGAYSRRRFIKMAAMAAAALPAGSALLAACGDTATVAPTAAAAASSAAMTTSAAVATTAAMTTTAAAGAATTTAAAALPNPPTVPNAAAAKAFASQSIKFYGDAVGSGADLDSTVAAQFTKDTGIKVTLLPRPDSSTDYYTALQRLFQGSSSEVDVMMLDVIWPGAFAQSLLDLTPKLGSLSSGYYDTAIQNNTVKGKLVAMPYFGDFGMLYYRTDLLQKYGFAKPPETWDELTTQAKKIQDGEKATNPNFAGFTFQGKTYEGLTCDALEWIASSGGGTIIDASGKVTINNDKAAAALTRAKGWVGTISPTGVTAYDEAGALDPFLQGNVAFLRNWPYAYAQGQDATKSKIVGKFDVAPLPHDVGEKSSGTLGGWQIGVNKNSKNQDAAIEFARYLTSKELQTYRGIVGGYVPLHKDAATDPAVLKAAPYLTNLANVVRVPRPSTATGINYNDVSTTFFQGVGKILQGQDAKTVLADVQKRIESALQ